MFCLLHQKINIDETFNKTINSEDNNANETILAQLHDSFETLEVDNDDEDEETDEVGPLETEGGEGEIILGVQLLVGVDLLVEEVEKGVDQVEDQQVVDSAGKGQVDGAGQAVEHLPLSTQLSQHYF